MKIEISILLFLTLKFIAHLQAAIILTKAVKQALLDNHNYYRSQIALGKVANQPESSDMVLLDWDDSAGERMSAWTDKCQFGHDANSNRLFTNASYVGQNGAYHGAANADLPSRVTSWYNEVKKYQYGTNYSPTTGHYTQLIWAATAIVGCGASDCTGRSTWKTVAGCNYEEGGNMPGVAPYRRGKPCSECPANYPKCHKGLCATVDQCAKLPAGSCTDSQNKGNWLKRAVPNKNVDGVISRVGDPPAQIAAG